MRILLFVLFLFSSPFLEASHIVGGIAQYEIINASDSLSTSVRVTFTLYRDPLSSGADFDTFAEFGIYQKAANGDYIHIDTEIADPIEVNPLSFDLSPNPVTEVLQINVAPSAHLVLEITDALGHLIMSRPLTKEKTNLSVNHLGAGIYFATISNTVNSRQQTQKFIIK